MGHWELPHVPHGIGADVPFAPRILQDRPERCQDGIDGLRPDAEPIPPKRSLEIQEAGESDRSQPQIRKPKAGNRDVAHDMGPVGLPGRAADLRSLPNQPRGRVLSQCDPTTVLDVGSPLDLIEDPTKLTLSDLAVVGDDTLVQFAGCVTVIYAPALPTFPLAGVLEDAHCLPPIPIEGPLVEGRS